MRSINFVCFFSIVMFLSGCASDPQIVLCPPDNRPVPVYSDPTKSYKDYVKSYDFSLEGLQTTLSDFNADLNIGATELKGKVTQLQESLNQNNISHKNTLRGIAMSQQADPCNTQANERLFAYLNKLSENAYELEKLKISLEKEIKSKNNSNVEKIIDTKISKESIESLEVGSSEDNESKNKDVSIKKIMESDSSF